MSKWKSLVALLGFTATLGATEKVELKDEHLDKIDASLEDAATIKAERDTLKTEVDGLKAAATATQTEITGLKTQVTALTTERDTLKADNERMAKLDAGKLTTTAAQEEKKIEESQDAMAMDFQKELLSKV